MAVFQQHVPIKSRNVVAHIRKARTGRVCVENTHPFQRELWGRYWIFAHNGNLLDFAPALNGSFVPVGCTDSERAFCWLLQELRSRFGSVAPPPADLFAAVHELTLTIASHGEFNFLLSNGDFLFAHASTKLAYIVRQAPFTQAHLNDQDVSVDFSDLTGADDRVAIIATLPLTDNETWMAMEPGTLWWFAEGAPVCSLETVPGPVKAPAVEPN
jgi:glutamine amidotransferase